MKSEFGMPIRSEESYALEDHPSRHDRHSAHHGGRRLHRGADVSAQPGRCGDERAPGRLVSVHREGVHPDVWAALTATWSTKGAQRVGAKRARRARTWARSAAPLAGSTIAT